MVTLRNPEAPATSKQLWLLHLLTKTDTRNLKLTMQQASDRINDLKNKPNRLTTTGKPQGDKARADYRISGTRPLVNPHTSAIKQDKQKLAQVRFDKALSKLGKRYQGCTGQGLNLGKIQVVQAYKEVSLHNNIDDGHKQICVYVKASGIFLGGKKPHIFTDFIKGKDTVTLAPLYGHIRHYPDVDRTEYHNWIKSLPVKFNKNVPEAWHGKALELAQAVDSQIDILDIEEV